MSELSTAYENLPGLGEIYLEDSWVLGVQAEPRAVRFVVDFVLREAHPLYAPPKTAEQYCYRRGALEFTGVTELRWGDQNTATPTVDLDGSTDYGNIDTVAFGDGLYEVTGDFGKLTIATSRWPAIALVADPSRPDEIETS